MQQNIHERPPSRLVRSTNAERTLAPAALVVRRLVDAEHVLEGHRGPQLLGPVGTIVDGQRVPVENRQCHVITV